MPGSTILKLVSAGMPAGMLTILLSRKFFEQTQVIMADESNNSLLTFFSFFTTNFPAASVQLKSFIVHSMVPCMSKEYDINYIVL